MIRRALTVLVAALLAGLCSGQRVAWHVPALRVWRCARPVRSAMQRAGAYAVRRRLVATLPMFFLLCACLAVELCGMACAGNVWLGGGALNA